MQSHNPTVNKGVLLESDPNYLLKPKVNGAKTFHGGEIKEYTGKVIEVTSPITDAKGERVVIGTLAQVNTDDVKEVMASAKKAWNNGRGEWPQMTMQQRIYAIEGVVASLKEVREEIVKVLMWEICKSTEDAAAEFDRTMVFIDATIKALRSTDEATGGWNTVSGILSRYRRGAIGIMMCLGPFNYPFNETYATLIPALLTGNIVVMKIPNTGGLAHVLTMEAYAKHLPKGTINFFSGSGRETLEPAMTTGDVDVLAFIGGSKAADTIIKAHPHPHRLKVFLQLEGKNTGIILPDADVESAVEQVVTGSTTFNGQRCTAVKMVMVHSSLAEQFVAKFKTSVNKLGYGLPWEANVKITPLPEKNKVVRMTELIEDAVSKGAELVNAKEGGGEVHGNLMRPAIVYPVTKDMQLWHVEQFGPVIPIGVYTDIEEVFEYLSTSPYGQQAAIFTKDARAAGPIVDVLSTIVGRININTQCGRSPDALPFSGRRSSALGTMSVTEALNAFSIETLIAGKSSATNDVILKGLDSSCNFLQPINNI